MPKGPCQAPLGCVPDKGGQGLGLELIVNTHKRIEPRHRRVHSVGVDSCAPGGACGSGVGFGGRNRLADLEGVPRNWEQLDDERDVRIVNHLSETGEDLISGPV